MIIDIHAHTSYKELTGLHTPSATLDVIENYSKQYGVVRVYLMATYFPLKKSGTGNLAMMERIGNRSSLFKFFGSLDFERPLAPSVSELRELAERSAISGIKLYPGYQNCTLADERMHEICQIADDFSLPVAIHTGTLHHCCRDYASNVMHACGFKDCQIDKRQSFAKPDMLLDMVCNFPNTNFIACHMANPYFSDIRYIMKKCSNLFTDMSGQFLSASHEDTPEYRLMLKHEIEKTVLECGIEKMLFGTDFPIQSYKDSIELVEALSLSAHDKDLIFYKNAINFLKEGNI